jgi:hypothetical protein
MQKLDIVLLSHALEAHIPYKLDQFIIDKSYSNLTLENMVTMQLKNEF